MPALQTIAVPTGAAREAAIARMAKVLAAMPPDKPLRVEVHEHKPRRSDAQNAYLWGVVYPTIAEKLEGWKKDDIHEYCLGEHFGWEVLEGLGRRRMRPLRRSSKLSKTEFMDYVADIQQRMAGHGIYIPDPNEGA